jgi:periplasmic protein TonB
MQLEAGLQSRSKRFFQWKIDVSRLKEATMFEQAVLPSGPPSGRFWAVAIGVTGEVLLVGCALIAPVLWPQFLPRPKLLTWLSLPTSPPSPVKPPAPVHVRPLRTPWQMIDERLRQPGAIPDKVATIEDPPDASPGVGGGISTGDLSGLVISVLKESSRVTPPLRPPEPKIARPMKPEAEPTPRVNVGGMVSMARLVRRVEPAYPSLARHARISGTVELTGVIGVDGRIRELQVVNGHPLLARAALEAVRQWVYEPTLLNGKPVEVIAPITVNFVLK